MNIGFYCRSGHTVGFGHVSRSAVLAREWQRRGASVSFFVEGEWPAFVERGFTIAPSLSALVAGVDVLLFDGVPAELIDELLRGHRPTALLVQIDDDGACAGGVDVILNPNLFGAAAMYPSYMRVLAGRDYNLVDACLFDPQVRDTDRDTCLVSFGGSDRGQFGVAVANRLLTRVSKLILALACQPSQCHTAVSDELARLAERGVRVLYNQPIAPLLPGCRLYVGAAGVTVQEAMAAGCRLAVCAIVANQLRNVETLRTAGYCALPAFDAEALASAAETVWSSATLPEPMLVTSGAKAIVEALSQCESSAQRWG